METYQYPKWLTEEDNKKEIINTYCKKKNTCIQDNFTPKFNNMSRKMMISKMLQTGKKLSYSNTRISNYINIITAANYDSNRRLLFVIGYPLYYKYLKKVLASQYISSTIKKNVENVYERILCRLTYEEKVRLEIITETNENVDGTTTTTTITAESFLDNVDFTFYVVIRYFGDKYNFVLKNITKSFVFTPGKVYKFDLTHKSNDGHKLAFSKLYKSYTPLDGIYYSSYFESKETEDVTMRDNRFLIFNPSVDIDHYTFYIYNLIDNTYNHYENRVDIIPDDYDIYGYMHNPLVLELNYQSKSKNRLLTYTSLVECLEHESFFKSYENKGPKIVFQSTNYDVDTQGLVSYNREKKYGLYYGTYYFRNVSYQYKIHNIKS